MSRIDLRSALAAAAVVAFLAFAQAADAWTKTLTFEGGAVGQVAQGANAFDAANSQVLFDGTTVKNGTRSAAVSVSSCASFWPTHAEEWPAEAVGYGGQMWARMWVYLPSNWSWASCYPEQADRIKWIRFTTTAGSVSILLSENGYIRPSNEPLGAANYEEPVMWNAYNEVSPTVDQGTLQKGQWVELEMYVYFHETAGIFRIWKNGTLIFQHRNTKTVPAGTGLYYTQYWGTWNRNAYVLGPGTSQAFYVDDLTLQTDVPTNVDAYGNRMISTSGVADTTPPSVTGTSPSGQQTCSSNPRDVTLTATTNEPATCRMATSDMAYDSMTDAFDSTGGASHSETKSLACGASYTYYVRCADYSGNTMTSSAQISFSIAAAGADTTPPVISSPSPSGALACTSNPMPVQLSVTTDEAATARMATSDMAYDSMTDAFDSTGGTSHSEVKSLACGQSYTYYVRAADGAGNKTPASTVISFSIQAQTGQGTLLVEPFEDSQFASRGWYDGTGGAIVSGGISGNCLECSFASGGTTCSGGVPKRRLFAASDTLYISFYVKFAAGWTSSNRSYHPHLFYVLSDLDSQWAGPSDTWQTLYIEENEGRARVGAADGQAIDEAHIGVDLCASSENRAVHGCNGICDGNAWDSIDCYDTGGSGGYQNGRMAASPVVFQPGQWHRVEVYYALNSVVGGVARKDGAMKLWVDGELKVNQTNMIYRTGARPTLRMNQLILSPYMGDGSPIAQKFWLDELIVAQSMPDGPAAPPVGGAAFKAFSGIWN